MSNDIPRVSPRVENRQLLVALLVTGTTGFALWALSPVVTGGREPFDAPGYYLAGMGGAGLAAGLLSRSALVIPVAYLGIWTGQVFATVGLQHLSSRWSILAVIVTGIGSLITLAAAV